MKRDLGGKSGIPIGAELVRKSTDVAKDGHDNAAPEELRIGGSEERKGFRLVTFLFFTPTFPLVNLRHVADLKDRINSILRGSCCLILHVDSMLRAAHLLPVFGSRPLPRKFYFSNSLDAFNSFYINKYADHHMNEIIH